MTEASGKYKDMTPEPLNCQFPDRVDQKTAVELHKETCRDSTLSTSMSFMPQVTQ